MGGNYSRSITLLTTRQFSDAFSSALIKAPPAGLGTEELVTLFNCTCTNILDSTAPYKVRKAKISKPKLQVSYQHLRYCLAKYQQCIKAERTKYFSDIIFKHVHRPKVLFNTINKVHNPAVTNCHEATSDTCEYFLRFFTSKLDTIQSQISPPAYDLSDLSSCSSVLTNFEPFSLSSLTHIISHMKPCTCPLDIIPPRLLKEVLDTVGLTILSIINSSLCLWLCPSLL